MYIDLEGSDDDIFSGANDKGSKGREKDDNNHEYTQAGENTRDYKEFCEKIEDLNKDDYEEFCEKIEDLNEDDYEEFCEKAANEDELHSLHSASEDDVSYPEFNESSNFASPQLCMGMKFSSHIIFRRALKEWAIRNGFGFKLLKNTSTRITAICHHLCGFKVHAIGRDGNENMFPLAIGLVDIEEKASWLWFIKLLLDDFGSMAQFEYRVTKLKEFDTNAYDWARDIPILSMFEWIRRRILKRFHVKYTAMLKYKGDICSNAQDTLEKLKFESRNCFCTLVGIPCKHAVSAIYTNREQPEKKPAGKPKKRRIRAIDEPRNPFKLTRAGGTVYCGNCKQKGHNVRGCKAALTRDTPWQRRQRLSRAKKMGEQNINERHNVTQSTSTTGPPSSKNGQKWLMKECAASTSQPTISTIDNV
ncbi:hypothetical protein GH714_008275 [Hevea brasiliensis]|uniref:SWIM-type domain-containing protein n=1 Tax=Hevea brasiliensis TaxID=3981 RepID=A0A6A6LZZ8_HEVBR|nr:hypothetical protein GH714_008275 [Hevea brasiliensis]